MVFYAQRLKSPECVKVLLNCLQNLETTMRNVNAIPPAAKKRQLKALSNFTRWSQRQHSSMKNLLNLRKKLRKITDRQKAWAKKTVKQLEAETQECSVEILRNFAKLTGKHRCQSLFFNKIGGLRPETLTQVYSCEFCKISKSTFSYRTPPVAACGQFLTKRLEQLDAVLDRLE